MSQDERPARRSREPRPWIAPELLNRFVATTFGLASVFILVALVSYHPEDLGLLSAETHQPSAPIGNLIGFVGAWIALAGRGGLGFASFVVPIVLVTMAMKRWRGTPSQATALARLIACVSLLAALATLIALAVPEAIDQAATGGVVGYLAVRTGRYYFGPLGTGLVAGAVALGALILMTDQLAFPGMIAGWFRGLGSSRLPIPWKRRASHRDEEPALGKPSGREDVRSEPKITIQGPQSVEAAARFRPPSPQKPKSSSAPVAAAPVKGARQAPGGFQLPSVDLLQDPPPISERKLGEDLQVNARILIETLREFGIEATCVNVDRGPSVTRYELAPAPGVKITKIVSLADDLALVLKAANCHIVAPIPGKGLVGVEVPNSTATIVYLKEIITSRAFQQANSPLSLSIGKDVSGQPVVFDLRDCPHLLVAGATGSGKTVFLNSLLTGILCHASPDQVKFLMIDPKMVELALFNDIPHLVAPVVTDAKKAAAILDWAVQEMERRYRRLSELGARNIDSYNQKAPPTPNEQGHGRMPYLVVVLDELADLMMVSSHEVEESITRLAQMARAVGIHVILATQRPSVDVITGVIKANFPARIAFQVATKVDSRTILDVNGADKLLGRGDLLFLKPGTAKPIRAQGAFLTDAEIERIVAHVKSQRPPAYDESIMNQPEKPLEPGQAIEKDELYDMAKELVISTGQASTSLLQRRLRLGYGRAARILDSMEQEGIVGPPQGSRPREVLVGQHAEQRG